MGLERSPSRLYTGAVKRLVLSGLSALGAFLGAGGALGCWAFSAPGYQGPKTPHFDGERFRNNPEPLAPHGFGDLLKWATHREPGPWPEIAPPAPGPRPPERVGPGEVRVTFVNHATVLVQLDGLNVLTDPIWSERASPVSWAGPKRQRPPGLRFEDLPPIDLVLVSHNHYDHLDLPTLKRLAEVHHPALVTGLGNDRLLEQEGLADVHALDWWEDREIRGLKVSGVPAKHFSARGTCDRNKTLWLGFVLHGLGGPVYFAGDTGYGTHFAKIRRRYGAPRLAVLPIGAYRPRWFMSPVHLSPADAYLAHVALEAGTSVAMHYGTFPLADDGRTEAVEALGRALDGARQEGADPRFWALDFGEGRDVPALGAGS